MTPCPDAWSLAALAGGHPLPGREALLEHAAACDACRTALADLASLPAARRTPLLPWAAAAALLLAVGLLPTWRAPETAQAVPRPSARSHLEVEPGGEAALAGGILSLRSGACWLDTQEDVTLEQPVRVRFAAGTEAEVRLAPPAGEAVWSLLRESRAGSAPEVRISVVSGCAEAGGFRIRAGSSARLLPGASPRLEPLDAAAIDAWRIRRLEGGAPGPERELRAPAGGTASVPFPAARGSYSAEVRAVEGHLVLCYPAGETLLGSLEAWKDASWHRLTVIWNGSGTEVFLDGKRLLKVPRSEGPGAPGLGVRSGSLRWRERLP